MTNQAQYNLSDTREPGASAVACTDLILPVKPCWFFDNMGKSGGECTHTPRDTSNRLAPRSVNQPEVLHDMNYYTSTTEFNCGIDLHAHQMCVCLLDRPAVPQGRESQRWKADRGPLWLRSARWSPNTTAMAPRRSLRVTPAMEAGLSNDIWTIEEIVRLLP
jgi:hypothetical protein